MTWRELRRLIAEDLDAAFTGKAARAMTRPAKLVSVASRAGTQAVLLFRVSSALNRRGWGVPAYVTAALNLWLTGAELPPSLHVGPGFVIRHPHGVVVHARARLGRRVTLYSGVVIGERGASESGPAPEVDDDVVLCTGAKVLGDVRVGRGACVGANAVVLADVPPGRSAIGVPARCA